MSHDQYTQRHGPDASLPGRACFMRNTQMKAFIAKSNAGLQYQSGPMDRRMDQRTDKASKRVASPRLETGIMTGHNSVRCVIMQKFF